MAARNEKQKAVMARNASLENSVWKQCCSVSEPGVGGGGCFEGSHKLCSCISNAVRIIHKAWNTIMPTILEMYAKRIIPQYFFHSVGYNTCVKNNGNNMNDPNSIGFAIQYRA